MGSDADYRIEDYLVSEFETSVLWLEAGFIPPAYYQKIIAALHRSSQGNGYIDIRKPEKDSFMARRHPAGCEGYYFFDIPRFFVFAQSLNLSIFNRNYEEIAEKIIEILVEDYGINFSSLKRPLCDSLSVVREKLAFDTEIS